VVRGFSLAVSWRTITKQSNTRRSATDAALVIAPAARPIRAVATEPSARARTMPKSDIDSRIPTAKSVMSGSSVTKDCRSNAAIIVSARNPLIANTAPTTAGTCVWPNGRG
jgi:hypothetical protein